MVFDNDFTTFETVIWGEFNIFWYQKFRFIARKKMVKTVCKLTKLVRNYGDARNKNYVLFKRFRAYQLNIYINKKNLYSNFVVLNYTQV